MSRTLRISLVQFDCTVGAAHAKRVRGATLITRARDVRVVNPAWISELAISANRSQDLLSPPDFLATPELTIPKIATAGIGIVAAVRWAESARPVVYKPASVVRNGRRLHGEVVG